MSARRSFGLMLCLVAGGAASAAAQAAGAYGSDSTAGRYLDVDGAKIYYEHYGSGRPVVLLHGGLFGYIDEFAGLIDALRQDRTVIAIALRGHGKSEMGRGPLTHQRIADDAAAVMRRELREPADVIGFSSGAMAAYRLTVSHPSLVRRLVAIGGPIAAAGATEAGMAEAKAYATPEQLEKLYPALVAKRKRLYADPAAWDRLVKAFAAIVAEPDVPEAAVRSIAQPTLIVAGDRDHYTRIDHFVDIYRLLPRGSLAIVPACGHVVLVCQPDLMLRLIRGYLDRP
ncbi:MAG: alpha/beta hydrolase [Gemmatimonadales bacterium]|nr:alpha/beta hydrolase [Gemmatimonadales bacterium]